MAHGAQGMRSLMRDRSVTKEKLPPGTLGRIMRFAAPYRRMLGVFLGVIVVDALIGVWNPLIYREIIDGGIVRHDSRLIVELGLLLAGLAIADALLSLAQRYISSRVGEGLIYDMREKVFGHVQEMPLAFFSRTQTGALISRLNNDVLGAQQAFTDTLSSIVSNLITVALTIAVMAFLSWQITVAALLLLPLFVFPARRIGRKLQQLTREAYNLNAQMNNTMTERFNVSGALLVKLFGRPDIEHEQFASRAARVRDIGVQTAMYGRVFFLSLVLTSSLATALVYGWGGVLAVDGRFKVGTVVALAALLTRLYGPLTALSNVNVDVMTALVSFDRVFEVLDLPPLIAERPDAVAIARGPVAVEFDHVDFSYPTAEEVSLASLESVAVLDQTPSSQVLYDVSFRAEPGQLVALVGPSGAGKTTISYLVSRLYDVRSGAVRLNGVDVRDVTFASLRDSIGVVTQDAHLFHETIRANLLYAKPDATSARAPRSRRRRPDPAVHRVAARRARHGRRRPRLPALGGRETAHSPRPPPFEGAGRGRLGRGHRPSRLGVRGGGPARAADGPREQDVHRDRTPALDCARRRPDPCRGRRAHRGARAPRGAAGGRRAVRGPVPHPVRAPGDRGGRGRRDLGPLRACRRHTGPVAVHDLDELLAQLSVRRRPGRWCIVSDVTVPFGMAVAATIVEDEGTTSVLSVTDAERLGARPEFVAAWLTVEVRSALGAVGLTAALATALAAENIACNVLAGYHHDHLLVPVEKADRAVAVLEALRDSPRR